jgi:hypothetical protein
MATRKKMLYLLTGFLGFVVLLGIVLSFSLPKLINSDAVKKKVNAYFSEKTGGSLALGQTEIHVFPLPHVAFRQVSISIPDKANGFVQSLDVYPDVWSLIRGEAKFSKIRIESPDFTVALSEDEEKLSLEQIEEKIRAILRDLTSAAHDLSVTVHKGKLDLTKEGKTIFSFSMIQSKLTISGSALNISVTSASDLWDTASVKIFLQAEDLKSKGSVEITNLRPDTLLQRFVPDSAQYVGDSDANVSVKFQTQGLRQIQAEVGSSVPRLALIRGKNRVSIEDLTFKGEIGMDSKGVSVLLSELNCADPELNMSGNYALDRTSGIMQLDLEAKAVDVQSTRSAALSIGGDIPTVKTIFSYLQGGKIPAVHFHAGGKSPGDLGRLENMQISGRMQNGDVYVPVKDLRFNNVSGDVAVTKGILKGKNIRAFLEKHQGSEGTLTIGLKGKDAPFHLDLLVKADMAELPLLLREKKLIKNEAVLREMDRLSDMRGTAQGRLILGDRLNSIHVVTDVSEMNLTARYEPLPFPLMITGGRFFFDEKSIKIAGAGGNLGHSSFTGVTSKIDLDDQTDFEITDGQMSVSTDELYPWITSFEKIKPVLKEVPSMSGVIAVSSLKLKGPFKQPKDWRFTVDGETKKFTLNAAFLPGKAEDTTGMFRITQDELSLKDIRTRMSDSVLTMSGTFREFPAPINTIALSLQGEVGPKVMDWISALIQLPPEISVRAPLSVSASTLLWEKAKKTTFDGRLVFGGETQVSLKLTKTPDELSVHEITIKDRNSDAAAHGMLNMKSIDIVFKGSLASPTFNAVFGKNIYSDSSLKGDFRTHILFKDPEQSVTEGVIHGKNLPVPWHFDTPLVVQDISLRAEKKRIVVDTAHLLLGKERFMLKGTIDSAPTSISVDMDLSADGINWESVENILQKAKERNGKKTAGAPESLLLKGSLRIEAGFFKYRQFTWEPFHADVNFDGNTVSVHARRAALCGISTTGDVTIAPSGAEIDIALSADNLELQPAILCISDKKADITGKFSMKADLKGKGPLDTIAKSMNGSFTIKAKKGKIYKSKSLDRTLDLVNKTENVKGTLPDLDKTIIKYRDFTASGTIKEHILELEESGLDAYSFGILSQGNIDLQSQTLDLNALVVPVNRIQRIVGKIPVLGKILGGSLVSIPVKIKGNISDPEVTFLSPSAVGSAFFGIIERTLKLPLTIIEPVLPAKK